MTAYYNEIDPKAAAWLRELIKQGNIAEGEVDERSIEDINPSELDEFTQCHFFAGIGVWSYALRKAGWPDDRRVWTGSCPCQPFSSAGKGKGTADERHLWPAFHHLIRECRPITVFGEQVANKAGESWFDIVSADLEAEGYASGLAVFPACGVGAPHQRKRLYWVANSAKERRQQKQSEKPSEVQREAYGTRGEHGPCSMGASVSSMADTSGRGLQERERHGGASRKASKSSTREDAAMGGTCVDRPGPTNGFWRDADWLGCRDGKWRPVEPGTFPLANGTPARVGRLRGYGNAIVEAQARAFIEAYMEVVG